MPNPAPQSVYSVVGDRYVILVTGDQTAGVYSVIEMHVPPGHGPPPHVHHREDEAFYIVDGEFEFTVASQPIRAGKGESSLANATCRTASRTSGAPSAP